MLNLSGLSTYANNTQFCNSQAILQQSKNQQGKKKTQLQLTFTLFNLVLSTQKTTNDHIKKGNISEYIHKIGLGI